VEDAYYPFGRGNMLEVAFLAALIQESLAQLKALTAGP
jgi:hypothetical protein